MNSSPIQHLMLQKPMYCAESEFFNLGIDSIESIPCENQFHRGIDSLGRDGWGWWEDPRTKSITALKIKEHGRLDSILGPYSIPGIGFFSHKPSKNTGKVICCKFVLQVSLLCSIRQYCSL
jgi:hypothetical protein